MPSPIAAPLLAVALTAVALAAPPAIAADSAAACTGTIYLTFDTGSQSQAEFIAATLKRHRIKATFFLANEKTTRGDWSLDPSWAAFWQARVAEGHAFGSHTFDHVYYQGDAAGGAIRVKPQFGAQAGRRLTWTPAQYCEEIKRSDARFRQLTGRGLDPIWRAPGGKVSPRTVDAGAACGYTHFGWTPAGFSGDETSSTAFPNALLLERMLTRLHDGDIVLAHMGIWSRQDPWAPAVLEPLISGLERKGLCFATLREHPAFTAAHGATTAHGTSRQ